jgi:inorganic pyrophosphatase
MRRLQTSLLPALSLALALGISAGPLGPPDPSAQVKPACPPAEPPPAALPAKAADRLQQALDDAGEHAPHVWRDTPALHGDGTVSVFVEIAPGSSEKHEFDMKRNRLELNRRIPESLGGYPTGYGFIPQTIGVDGDPFDGLVLGDAPHGVLVRGHIVGIMHMTDEKGHDAKIVVSAEPDAAKRRALLNDAERARIADFFNRYKAEDDDDESWACVSGWGDVEEARGYLDRAHRLFVQGGNGGNGENRTEETKSRRTNEEDSAWVRGLDAGRARAVGAGRRAGAG